MGTCSAVSGSDIDDYLISNVLQAHVVPTVVQGASGQKNVILRVVPQQVMTSEGLVNMILPQQMLQQSLKVSPVQCLSAGGGQLYRLIRIHVYVLEIIYYMG